VPILLSIWPALERGYFLVSPPAVMPSLEAVGEINVLSDKFQR